MKRHAPSTCLAVDTARPSHQAELFRSGKGPRWVSCCCQRQASYDGALGARETHSFWSYGQDEPVYENNAYAITSTYHDGHLKMYASYLAQPASPGGRPEYYMSQINTWGMTGNVETFRQGATAYQNARE